LSPVLIVFVALNSKGKPIVHRLARSAAEPKRLLWAHAAWPKWLGGRNVTEVS